MTVSPYDPTNPQPTGPPLDPDPLLRRLDLVLTGGTLTPRNFQTIRESMMRITPATWEWPTERLKLGIYLILHQPGIRRPTLNTARPPLSLPPSCSRAGQLRRRQQHPGAEHLAQSQARRHRRRRLPPRRAANTARWSAFFSRAATTASTCSRLTAGRRRPRRIHLPNTPPAARPWPWPRPISWRFIPRIHRAALSACMGACRNSPRSLTPVTRPSSRMWAPSSSRCSTTPRSPQPRSACRSGSIRTATKFSNGRPACRIAAAALAGPAGCSTK